MNITNVVKTSLNTVSQATAAKVRPVWKNFAENDTRQIFEKFNYKHKIFGNLDITIQKRENEFNRWVIEIKNALNKNLGKEIIAIDKDNNTMTGFNIIVEPSYRKKGFKFGELLRLFSVM